LIGEKRKREI